MITKASSANGVPVAEVHQDTADLGRCAQLLMQPFVFFAPVRTGMSVGLVLPQLLDLASKPKS